MDYTEIPAKEQARDLSKKELSQIPKFYSKNFLLNKHAIETGKIISQLWKDKYSFYSFIKSGNFRISVSRDSIVLKDQIDKWKNISKSGNAPDFRIETSIKSISHITPEFNYVIITTETEGNCFVHNIQGSKLLRYKNILGRYEEKLNSNK